MTGPAPVSPTPRRSRLAGWVFALVVTWGLLPAAAAQPACAAEGDGPACLRHVSTPPHPSADFRREPGYRETATRARALRQRQALQRRATESVGDRRTFATRDLLVAGTWVDRTFELLAATDEVAVWGEVAALDAVGVERYRGIADSLAAVAALRGRAGAAEGALRTVRRHFGAPPDVDADGRLDVLVFDIVDQYAQTGGYVTGYFDPVDLTDHPRSNRRDVVYLDLVPTILRGGPPETDEAAATLVHEYQHLIHAGAETGPEPEVPFVNEGLSEYAEVLAGFPPRSPGAFVDAAPRSLFAWVHDDPLPDYARASLFVHYLFERVGTEHLRAFVQDPATGRAGVEALLARAGGPSLEAVVGDWAAALVGGPAAARPYRHPLRADLALRPRHVVGRLPGAVSLAAPPLSVGLVSVPLAETLRLDAGPAAAGRRAVAGVRYADGGRAVGAVALDGAPQTFAAGPYPDAVVALIAGEAHGGPWEVVAEGVAAGAERTARYDDGTPDPFTETATYLIVREGEAVAVAFAGGAETRLRAAEFDVLFLSELRGTGVPSEAPRDLVVEVTAFRDGRPAEPLAAPSTVRMTRPRGVLRFEPAALGGAVPLTPPDSFAVVLRNDADDANLFAVAVDRNAGPAAWAPAGAGWRPFGDRVAGGRSLAGFTPMVRARMLVPAEAPRPLPRPSIAVGPDSVTVAFAGVGPVDPAASSAYLRTADGRGHPGALRGNDAGGVRYAFPATAVGAATAAVSLVGPDGAARGGVFVVEVPAGGGLELGEPYPNPGTGPLRLPLRLPAEATVSAVLLDVLGREVARWPGRARPRGAGELRLALPAVAAGPYLLRVSAQGGSETLTRSVAVTRLR